MSSIHSTLIHRVLHSGRFTKIGGGWGRSLGKGKNRWDQIRWENQALKDESDQEFHGFIYTNKILCEVTFRMMTHYSLRIWPDIIFLQRKWRLFQMAKRRSALHRMMFISRQPKSSGPDVHSTTNLKMMRFKKKVYALWKSCSLQVFDPPRSVECWLLVQFPFSGFLHGLPTRLKDA